MDDGPYWFRARYTNTLGQKATTKWNIVFLSTNPKGKRYIFHFGLGREKFFGPREGEEFVKIEEPKEANNGN